MAWVAIAMLVSMGTGAAAQQWLKLTTSNFELYTTAGERAGRDAILHFEKVRGFFAQATGSAPASSGRVRIIAFRNDSEYKPYRPNEFATAYYQAGPDRDYIVMKSVASEYYPVVVHEYVHMLVKHSGVKLPVWLNEGMAELYSNMRPLGAKVMVGDLIPGRMRELMTQKWIDLEAVLAVDHVSPLYNEKNRAGIFYSESWALTHMLSLSAAYRPGYRNLLQALGDGTPAAEVFSRVYSKPAAQVKKDLESYIRSNVIQVLMFDIKLEKSAESPSVESGAAFEAGLTLATLLGLQRKTAEAQRAFEELEQSTPGRPEVAEAHGYLAWMNRDREQAAGHFAAAAERKSANPKLYFDYANLLLSRDPRSNQAAPLFERALTLKPDYVEARLQLGYLYLNLQQFARAAIHLRQVKTVTKEQAFQFFHALAYSAYRLDMKDDARKAALRAKEVASSDKERADVDRLVQAIDRPQPPAPVKVEMTTVPVPPAAGSPVQTPPSSPVPALRKPREVIEGKIERLDCLGQGSAPLGADSRENGRADDY